MKSRLQKLLFSLWIEVMTATCLMASAFAVTITEQVNLTSFAGGDTATHSHIWVQKYDDTNHWDECSLCGAKQSVVSHTVSSSYSLGAGNCNYNNRKTTVCSVCGWSKTEAVSQGHTNNGPADYVPDEGCELEHEFERYGVNSITPLATTGLSDVAAFAFCSRCKDIYGPQYTTKNGGVTDKDGNPIDIDSVTKPIDLYVNGQLVSKNYNIKAQQISWAIDENLSYTLVNNNSQIRIQGTIDISKNAEFWGAYQNASAKTVHLQIYTGGTTDAGSAKYTWLNFYPSVSNTGIINIDETVSARDTTQKYSAPMVVYANYVRILYSELLGY